MNADPEASAQIDEQRQRIAEIDRWLAKPELGDLARAGLEESRADALSIIYLLERGSAT